jgi:CxxC motif-containing protein (DUF1111 family)
LRAAPPKTRVLRFSNQTANLFSDLLVDHMGEGLADGITQGGAGPDEFRTAPLERHDSEANKAVERFNKLSIKEQQEIIDFLRTL